MNKTRYSVEKMCQLFRVSKTAYYHWLKRVKKPLKKNELVEKVLHEFEKSKRTYGSPRICIELQEDGINVSKSTVARIMQSASIQARPRRKFVHTTDSKHQYRIFQNELVRNFLSERVNEKWVSDITYIPTKSGWTYLTTIIDLADRMVVGWNLSKDLSANNTTVKALKIALQRRYITNPLLFHSDRGVQYCCSEFRNEIGKTKWIKQSMSRKGNCWDNAPAESFFKTLKTEWTKKFKYKSFNEAKASIFDYIERWYNTQRRHSANNYMTPLQKYIFLTKTAA